MTTKPLLYVEKDKERWSDTHLLNGCSLVASDETTHDDVFKEHHLKCRQQWVAVQHWQPINRQLPNICVQTLDLSLQENNHTQGSEL